MNKYFFINATSERNEWWRYVLTLILVVTGILGFGGIPLQIAMYTKGISLKDTPDLSQAELMELFTNNELLAYQLFPLAVGFFMLMLAIRFNHRKPILSFFTSRKQLDLKRFFVGFGLWFGIQTILLVIELSQNSGTVIWNYDAGSFFLLCCICLFIVPLQTGFEELFCRGFILKWTGLASARGIAVIIINGLIFGGLHLMNPEVTSLGWFAIVFYMLSGVFAALLTIMDDGIELSWGYHTANNFMGLLIISNQWQSLKTDSLLLDTSKPSVGWGLVITLVICYPLMVFVLAKIYRWTNWKDRLVGK